MSDLPVPAGPKNQGAGTGLDPAAHQGVELLDAGRKLRACESGHMLRRHQPREDVDAAGPDREIVKTAAIALPAILQHAQTPTLGAEGGRHFLEPDDPVGDAVNRLVRRFRGQIVQHDHRRAMTGEVMLDGEDLAPVAQRTLGQQANFREAVEHHARRLDALDSVEDLARGFAQLEVG